MKHNRPRSSEASSQMPAEAMGRAGSTERASGAGDSSSGRLHTAWAMDIVVGRRIRERREALNITQIHLGHLLGITFSQIQKYEKGSNRIGAGRLFLIAQFLGVPVAHFFDEGTAMSESDANSLETLDLFEAYESMDPGARSAVLALVHALRPADAAPGGALA